MIAEERNKITGREREAQNYTSERIQANGAMETLDALCGSKKAPQ
jgi:hypothetical protein